MTPARKKKIEKVAAHRQKDLAVVLDHVDDPHNIGAILRSCDAFGIDQVHLLYEKNRPPRLGKLKTKSAASAAKWLNIKKWYSSAELIAALHKEKKRIVVTDLSKKAKDLTKTDLTVPLAIVIGNEHDGVSQAMSNAADLNIKIPMVGFVQSFNVSVAAAILMYEAVRQRNA